MMRPNASQFVRGFWATSLGTLASRVSGLLRDIVTAALLGLGQGGVMDALVVAFRIPNLARRVLGEGALATSLLPVLTREHERSPRDAWRLVSVLLVLLAVGLLALVLCGQLICLAWWYFARPDDTTLLGLTVFLLPYLIFVCLAAQVSATLNGLMRFRAAALAPLLLNVCWILAAWQVAPRCSGDPAAQAYIIALAVVLSGALQLAVLLPPLYRCGFRFQFDLAAAFPAVRQVTHTMLPIAAGLAVTQINTLFDTLLAVLLAAEPGSVQTIAWLGHLVTYPLETGAAAAIYYGERFHQLPVGLLGMAVATVLFPALARHAARGDRPQIGQDLTDGLRLVWFLALPAGVGLILLAEPVMQLLFVRGSFTTEDAHRAAVMIACYATATWAYCALPVLARGFYAVGDRVAPLRAGIVAVVLNLAITSLLVWPLGERGLALSTALAATVQVIVLLVLWIRTGPALDLAALAATAAKGSVATAAMAGTVAIWQRATDDGGQSAVFWPYARLALAVGLGTCVYLMVARLLGMRELAIFRLRTSLHDLPRANLAPAGARAQLRHAYAMISRIGSP